MDKTEVNNVNAQQAVAKRIRELLKENGMTLNKLSMESGVAKSVLHGTLVGNPPRVQNTSIRTIQKICQVFDMSLRDFFDSELFDDLENEEEK